MHSDVCPSLSGGAAAAAAAGADGAVGGVNESPPIPVSEDQREKVNIS